MIIVPVASTIQGFTMSLLAEDSLFDLDTLIGRPTGKAELLVVIIVPAAFPNGTTTLISHGAAAVCGIT